MGCHYDAEKEKTVQEIKNLGYYPTKAEAEKALADYNSSPYDLSNKVVTFEDLYKEWSVKYFESISKSAERTVVAAHREKEIGRSQYKAEDEINV